jgi:hypothetical protein
MESNKFEIPRHKDTLISLESNETCKITHNSLASSSNVLDKNTRGRKHRSSRLSLKIESLLEHESESILDSSIEFTDKKEKVNF